jgi:hypothetical protein
MKKLLVMLAVLSASVNSLAAGPPPLVSGKQFITACDGGTRGADKSLKTWCTTFFLGVLSGVNTMEEISSVKYKNHVRFYCLPEGATNDILFDISKKFIRTHPHSDSLDASLLIITAIQMSYPCE